MTPETTAEFTHKTEVQIGSEPWETTTYDAMVGRMMETAFMGLKSLHEGGLTAEEGAIVRQALETIHNAQRRIYSTV